MENYNKAKEGDEIVTIGIYGPHNKAPVIEAANFLKAHDDYMIVCHRKPDGDTVGSAFALRAALRAMGKRAQIACSDPITDRYSMITGGESEPVFDFEPKTIVTVDTASPSLLGNRLSHLEGKVDLVIDHHPSCTNYGKVNVVYPTAAAAGEIIWHIIKELGVEIDKHMATCIYVAISTDTGCFKYSNTYPSVLRMAADIAEMGVSLHELNYLLFMLKSRSRLAIEARVVDTSKMFRDGTIAVGIVRESDKAEIGATEDDMDDLGTLMRCIEGVEVGILLKEDGQGFYKVSLRSNAKINVSQLAENFGGGGHRRAAGCSVRGSEQEAVMALVNAAIREFDMIEEG